MRRKSALGHPRLTCSNLFTCCSHPVPCSGACCNGERGALTIPRLTFVAMGNGAPDLSANISAIRNGSVQLSAGAFTGVGSAAICGR
eukprot:241477-Chlamydomonas_euryale.AAC.1